MVIIENMMKRYGVKGKGYNGCTLTDDTCEHLINKKCRSEVWCDCSKGVDKFIYQFTKEKAWDLLRFSLQLGHLDSYGFLKLKNRYSGIYTLFKDIPRIVFKGETDLEALASLIYQLHPHLTEEQRKQVKSILER